MNETVLFQALTDYQTKRKWKIFIKMNTTNLYFNPFVYTPIKKNFVFDFNL